MNNAVKNESTVPKLSIAATNQDDNSAHLESWVCVYPREEP
jgi:hypothetical protein